MMIENYYVVYEFNTINRTKENPLECIDYQMAKEFAYVVALQHCEFKSPIFIGNLCIGDSNIGALIEVKCQ